MGILKQAFIRQPKVPIMFQEKLNDCGLACIKMIVGYYKPKLSINYDGMYEESRNGMTVESLVNVASQVGLSANVSQAQWHQLQYIDKPCILFWNENHYVVLAESNKKGCMIHDPREGKVFYYWLQMYRNYSKICIEFTPKENCYLNIKQ